MSRALRLSNQPKHQVAIGRMTPLHEISPVLAAALANDWSKYRQVGRVAVASRNSHTYGGLRHKACIRRHRRITEKRSISTVPRRSLKLCRSLVPQVAGAGLRLDAYRQNLMRRGVVCSLATIENIG